MFIGSYRATPPLAKNRCELAVPRLTSRLGLQLNFRILEDSLLGAYVGALGRHPAANMT